MRRLSLIMTGVLLVICLFGLSGCSPKSVKEKEIFEDIKKSDTYCSTFDFTYDSMEVIKRMTDEENRSDNVWVNFTCHNDDFEYTVECEVEYILYNEGWVFENYEIISSSYSALTKPNIKTVLEDFGYLELESVEEWEERDLDEDQNTYTFVGYGQDKISEYFSWDKGYGISYNFTPNKGWSGEIFETEQHENWNWDAFVGEWVNNHHDIYLYQFEKIYINSIDAGYIDVDCYHYHLGKTFPENNLMEYVTGDEYYPNDIPVYHFFANLGYGYWDSFSITPYGIYNFFPEDESGNRIIDDEYSYTKIS